MSHLDPPNDPGAMRPSPSSSASISTSSSSSKKDHNPNNPNDPLSNPHSNDLEKCAPGSRSQSPFPSNPEDTNPSSNAPSSPPDAPNPSSNKDESRPPSKKVSFSENDKEDPKNWSLAKRFAATAALAMLTFVVTFASSIFSAAITPVSEEFGVGETVATLGVSLFLLGFVFGPILFGPLSEVSGRRPPLLLGFAVFTIFQIPVAVTDHLAVILVFRFLGGFAACAPLAILGGMLADLWMPVERAYAICALAFAAFGGPVVGPIVGGFVTQSHLGWRWTAWLTLIAGGAACVFGVFAIPESSGRKILKMRAERLRKETGDGELWAEAEQDRITFETIFRVYLVRPMLMISSDLILLLITLYMSFLYGVLYLLFEAFPVSFHDQRGWNEGVSALPFVSFVVGTLLGCALMAYSSATNFKRAYIKNGVCIPEERLPQMMVGAVALPIGFFWFGWTSNPGIIWVPQVLSVALIGMGMVTTFWSGMSYMIDCYGFYSNSAIAVNTFLRSIAGAAFPLFAVYMYKGMGVDWASSLLGFLCILFVPAPFLFYKYGAKIRARSKWAPT